MFRRIFVSSCVSFRHQSGRTVATTSQRTTDSSSNSGNPDTFWPRVPRTPGELVEFITKNVVWISDDYIASAKPYEISTYGKPWSVLRREEKRRHDTNEGLPFDYWEEGEHGQNEDYGGGSDGIMTVASVLPYLKKAFASDHLVIAKTVPKYYEGPLLLARNENAKNAAIRSLWRGFSRPLFFMKALYICVGKPPASNGEGWCYSKVEFINDDEGYQYTLHPTAPSRRAERRDEILRGRFRYRALAYEAEADCSLVELELMKMNHQLDRLFLLDQGCPILGDALNQKCMARVLGQPVYVPHKRATIRNQYIPTGLLKKLRISLKEYHQLPMFAHVHSLTFPGLIRRGKKSRDDVELRVPMPSYFVAVLRALDWLRIVEEDERRRQQEQPGISERDLSFS